MTFGIVVVFAWFAVVAAYLLWQYATSALVRAEQAETSCRIETLLVQSPVVAAAPVTVTMPVFCRRRATVA